MTAQFLLDTNVVAYAASNDAGDAAKTKISRQLLLSESVGLSAQVLQEFFVVVTNLIRRAIRLHERYQIHYWDGAIIAAAKELAATTVFSEDLNHGQTYDGVTVLNPFLPDTILPSESGRAGSL